jgi:hypothetical protein
MPGSACKTPARWAAALFCLACFAAGRMPLDARGAADRGADWPPLLRLVYENNLPGIQAYLDAQGPRAATESLPGGVTALHLAAAMNRALLVDLLTSRGAWLTAGTDNGFTPLHWAAARDAAAAMQVLLDKRADVPGPSPQGITPLHWAAGRNATNAIALLLAAGADVTAVTTGGFTALHWALAAHADDAAVMLAFAAVDQDADTDFPRPPRPDRPVPNLDLPGAQAILAEGIPEPEEPLAASPDAAAAADDAMPADPVTAPPTPAPGPGRAICRIELGFGQILSFVQLPGLDLWFGRQEVSNAQYRRFRPEHDSLFRESFSLNNDDQPAVYVSWEDAAAFCEWINRYYRHQLPPGMQCRLPTAAEWETAARCATDRRYPWGDTWPPAYGNVADAAAMRAFPGTRGIADYDDGETVTCSVGRSGINEWGIYGLAGNVWEWCEDWHDPGRRAFKVRKGGGWDFEEPVALEIAANGFDAPEARYDTIGFRPVLAPVTPPPGDAADAGDIPAGTPD